MGSTSGASHDEEDIKGSPKVTTLMEQHGEIITTQNITSKTRTVETVTVTLNLLSGFQPGGLFFLLFCLIS